MLKLLLVCSNKLVFCSILFTLLEHLFTWLLCFIPVVGNQLSLADLPYWHTKFQRLFNSCSVILCLLGKDYIWAFCTWKNCICSKYGCIWALISSDYACILALIPFECDWIWLTVHQLSWPVSKTNYVSFCHHSIFFAYRVYYIIKQVLIESCSFGTNCHKSTVL